MDGKEPTYDILELAAKWHNGTITEAEKAFYEQWYASFNDTELALNQAEAEYEKLSGRIYSSVEHRIAADSEVNEIAVLHSEADIANSSVRRLWPRVAVAAAAVAAITLGVWLYNMSGTPRHLDNRRDLVVNDVAPGSNGATLTLASGKVINLSDAKSGVIVGKELKYDDGTDLGDRHPELVSGSRTIQALTATTAKGQTYQFTLPDGTKVWLNADSKLEFPSNFSGAKQRIVSLSGEGYFEVAKDKAHPFLVESGNQQVEVLGTHFNINAYTTEGKTTTTLLEGAVRVSSSRQSAATRDLSLRRDDVVLKPGQQSELSYAPSGKIEVTEVDLEDAIAWKEGYFLLDNDDFEGIMNKISRWYNVEIIYDTMPQDIQFGGRVSRTRNVSAVLEALERTGKVKFKIEGRRITVLGK